MLPHPYRTLPRALAPASAPVLAGVALILGIGAGCGGTEPVDDGMVNCDLETRADEFTIGLAKTGNASVLGFQLMTAMPAPPSRGDNVWTIQVDAAGAPVGGASLIVTPFMPDHEHGTPIPVEILAMPTAGQYQLSPVNMWMPGLWETTIDVTSASGNDRVVYRFCIPS